MQRLVVGAAAQAQGRAAVPGGAENQITGPLGPAVMQPRRWRAGPKPGKMQRAAKGVKRAVTKYEWYKAHGICPTCGCRDAAPGRVQCPECLEKERLKAVQKRKKESPEQKEYHNRHRQRRTDLLHAFGVCVRCQRRDAAPGRAQCVYCLARSRRYMQSRLREKGVMPRDMRGMAGNMQPMRKADRYAGGAQIVPRMPGSIAAFHGNCPQQPHGKNWFARTHSLMAWGKP